MNLNNAGSSGILDKALIASVAAVRIEPKICSDQEIASWVTFFVLRMSEMGHKRRGSPVEKAVLDTPIACNAAFLWGFNPRLGANVLNRCPKRVPFQLAAIIAHPSDEHVMPSKVIFAKRFRLRFVVLMRQGRSRVWIRDLTPWKRKVRDPKIVKPEGSAERILLSTSSATCADPE